tara:strand:+ start:43 stop:618 length:576 start_codon:yes stop_codon:yes gene_type:complete
MLFLMSNLSTDFKEKKSNLWKLLQERSYRNGDFTLSSGKKSPHYINCKPVSLNGYGLNLISDLFLELIDPNSKAVAGLTLGADPLVSGVIVLAANRSLFLDGLIIRKEVKKYGTKAGLEGPDLAPYAVVTVLEDVVTTAGSCLKAIQKLRDNNFIVNEVIAIVDREEGGKENLLKKDINLKSLFTISDFVN